MELAPVVTVTFAAFAPGMLAAFTMLAGLALSAFAALTFFATLLAFPILAPVVVDLYDMIWRDSTDGRDLKSRCWRAG